MPVREKIFRYKGTSFCYNKYGLPTALGSNETISGFETPYLHLQNAVFAGFEQILVCVVGGVLRKYTFRTGKNIDSS